MGERRATVAGIDVRWYEAEPRTPAPTLYVHGVPNSGSLWLPFLRRTGGVAPDLPGFGRSDKSNAFDYSIDGYADFLETFVDELGHERLQLVVHDWGAVGLALAQRRPAAVERLVVVDAVPFLPGYRWHQVARVWRTPVAGEVFMGSTTRFTARLLLRRLGALPAGRADAFLDSFLADFDHGTQRAILRLYRSAPPDVLARAGERLAEITAPALVVWGAEEPFIGTEFASAYADALGGEATVDVVEGAGHWPWLDRAEVIDRVAGFLGA